jgi:transcriptional regulator with XRE-family HTH domain
MFGSELKSLREGRGNSTAARARQLGISKDEYVAIEAGKLAPNSNVFAKLCAVDGRLNKYVHVVREARHAEHKSSTEALPLPPKTFRESYLRVRDDHEGWSDQALASFLGATLPYVASLSRDDRPTMDEAMFHQLCTAFPELEDGPKPILVTRPALALVKTPTSAPEELMPLKTPPNEDAKSAETAVFETFGAALRHYRKNHGFSAAELGELIDTDGSSVGYWERDQHPPLHATYERILALIPALKNCPAPVWGRPGRPARAKHQPAAQEAPSMSHIGKPITHRLPFPPALTASASRQNAAEAAPEPKSAVQPRNGALKGWTRSVLDYKLHFEGAAQSLVFDLLKKGRDMGLTLDEVIELLEPEDTGADD